MRAARVIPCMFFFSWRGPSFWRACPTQISHALLFWDGLALLRYLGISGVIWVFWWCLVWFQYFDDFQCDLGKVDVFVVFVRNSWVFVRNFMFRWRRDFRVGGCFWSWRPLEIRHFWILFVCFTQFFLSQKIDTIPSTNTSVPFHSGSLIFDNLSRYLLIFRVRCRH